MKIRNGFVSNSSSTSFIVIGTVKNDDTIASLRKEWGNQEVLHVTPDLGRHHFGWERRTYTHFWDRVIFSWIQAKYVQSSYPDWMEMLNDVLKDKLNVKQISWELSVVGNTGNYKDQCFIDHASASNEGRNTNMFENKQTLGMFLFSPSSYIQGGNVNE